MKKIPITMLLIASFAAQSGTLYDSRAELSSVVPITNGSANIYIIAYSVCVPINGDAIVDIRTQFEVTNQYTYNVGLGRGILSTDYVDSACTLAGSNTRRITPFVMDNVTPSEHHAAISSSVMDRVNFGSSGYRRYKLILYASASSTILNNFLKIESGYGFIQVLL